MKPILNRIKALINHLGFSDSQFAKTCDFPQTTISNMFNRDSEPRFDLLQKIILNYNVNSNWLITGEGEMFDKAEALPVKVEKIPLLSQSVSCGPGQNWESDDNIETYLEPYGLLSQSSGRKVYAFRAKGISMTGIGIQDGDILFFDGSYDQEMSDGVYVFGFAGEAYCKLLRFERLENKVMIFSVQHRDLRDVELVKTVDINSPEFKIFGRVLAWLHENTMNRIR